MLCLSFKADTIFAIKINVDTLISNKKNSSLFLYISAIIAALHTKKKYKFYKKTNNYEPGNPRKTRKVLCYRRNR